MSQKAAFHRALSHLAYADAQQTLDYVLAESRQIETTVRQGILQDFREKRLDISILAEMICNPAIYMLALDEQGTILNLNRAQMRVFQRPKSAMLGVTVWDYFAPEVQRCRQAVMRDAIDMNLPVRVRDVNMLRQTVDCLVIPISQKRVIVLNRPITKARQFEEAFSPRPRIIE